MNNRVMVLKGDSPAIHMLGDIRREDDDYIIVKDETFDEYIGNFLEGFGFMNVEFNKEDVRPCTREEIDYLNGCVCTLNGTPLCMGNFNYDGTPKGGD